MGLRSNTCINCGAKDVETFYCRRYNWDLCGTCYTSTLARVQAISYPSIVHAI